MNEHYLGNNDNQEVDKRLQRIFAPLVRPELPPELDAVPDYAHLFDESDEVYQEGVEAQIERDKPRQAILEARRRYDTMITPETKALSAANLEKLIGVDRDFAEIISQSFEPDIDSVEIVDALRQDEQLRYQAGSYLLDKINRLTEVYPDQMPDRIVDNKQKNPDNMVIEVGPMSSREYAAFLALAKLDGSFNPDLSASDDDIKYDHSSSKIIAGQHRFAAEVAISS